MSDHYAHYLGQCPAHCKVDAHHRVTRWLPAPGDKKPSDAPYARYVFLQHIQNILHIYYKYPCWNHPPIYSGKSPLICMGHVEYLQSASYTDKSYPQRLLGRRFCHSTNSARCRDTCLGFLNYCTLIMKPFLILSLFHLLFTPIIYTYNI